MKPLTEEFFDATEGMMLDADATNYATLTIGGKSVPVSDVDVVDEQGLVALRDAARTGPVRFYFTMHVWSKPKPTRWRTLRQRRHEKAAARRTKMRAARYAARWEQAHLRNKPAPVDRAERVRRAVDELEALVGAWENSK